jgi:hypothetical protein
MYLPYISRGVEGQMTRSCDKFVGTPTSRGRVEFPTWKFSLPKRFSSLFLPPPQTPTDLLPPSGQMALMPQSP